MSWFPSLTPDILQWLDSGAIFRPFLNTDHVHAAGRQILTSQVSCNRSFVVGVVLVWGGREGVVAVGGACAPSVQCEVSMLKQHVLKM